MRIARRPPGASGQKYIFYTLCSGSVRTREASLLLFTGALIENVCKHFRMLGQTISVSTLKLIIMNNPLMCVIRLQPLV